MKLSHDDIARIEGFLTDYEDGLGQHGLFAKYNLRFDQQGSQILYGLRALGIQFQRRRKEYRASTARSIRPLVVNALLEDRSAAYAEIAAILGCNHQYVRKTAIEENLQRRRPRLPQATHNRERPGSPHDCATSAAVCGLKGLKSAREIGIQFGLSRDAVIGIWHRHSTPSSPRESAA